MYVVAVTVFVKPPFVRPFIEAALDNARVTPSAGGATESTSPRARAFSGE